MTARTNEVKGAILNIRQAMVNAGYSDSQYKIIIQTYVSPIPIGSGFRYSESGWTRQSVGVVASGTRMPTGRTTPRS